MIHSGGAYGGHYYAYIKDFETDKWHQFNDSTVRDISFLDIIEVFGETQALGKAGLPQKRVSANHANAYMLMYRIVDQAEDAQSLIVHDDDIPDEIRNDVLMSDIVMVE